MSETVYLQLPRGDEAARWLRVDALGNRVGHVQQGAPGELPPSTPGQRLVVIAPGEHTALLKADIPSRNLQKALQAAPFTLEDRLAEDVENLHFAAASRAGGGYLVAVTARARMRSWMEALAAAGLKPDQLVPDILALPAEESACVALDGDFLLVRFPDGSGFGAERALASPILRRQLQPGGEEAVPKRIVIHAEADAGAALAAELGDGVVIEQQPLVDGLLPLLARSLRGHRPLSLLQGEFQTRSDLQEHWRTWRVSAALLAALLLLGAVQEIATFVHLKREATALDGQVATLMSAAMPGGRVVAGAEQNQLKQLLSQLQGGSSAGNLLSLLEVLGSALAGNSMVQISALNYQGGTLQAQLQAGDVGSLDALKAALGQQPGLSVNLDSVSASGNQVSGRLLLGENAP